MNFVLIEKYISYENLHDTEMKYVQNFIKIHLLVSELWAHKVCDYKEWCGTMAFNNNILKHFLIEFRNNIFH